VNIEDQVLALIEEGNPILDPDALSADLSYSAVHLAKLDRRSNEVTHLETKPEQSRSRNQPRWTWLVAAIVIAGISLIVVMNRVVDTGPPAAAPVSVVVPATEQWTDTGIDLSIDDGVLIEADGTIKPAPYEALLGPDGAIDRPDARQYNVEGLEEANHAGLIGRIGGAGAPFQVGSELLFEADTEGRLFLGINDSGVNNNAGEFAATITVNP